MQIVIMRHGEPDVPQFTGKVGYRQFRQCLAAYRECGIAPATRPADDVIKAFGDVDAVVCSDLKRSVESAALLCAGKAPIKDPLFREIDDSMLPVPWLRLTPEGWAGFYIVLWYCGLLGLRRGFRDGKVRAGNCANVLTELARQHERVLLVGHGFMNVYIARALNASGWTGPAMPSKGYWEYAVYEKTSI